MMQGQHPEAAGVTNGLHVVTYITELTSKDQADATNEDYLIFVL